MNAMPICHITRVPVTISPVSGLMPLTAKMGTREILYSLHWHSLQKRSWRLGNAVRQWGIRHHGSTWSGLIPYWDEMRFLRRLGRTRAPGVAHFLWGEFGAPSRVAPYHRLGWKVAVSVHCSARRWETVWLRPDGYAQADLVVLTSESQRPLVARHVPAERIRTMPLGVDVDHFRPPEARPPARGKLRLLLLGNTERDHEFAARVAAKLPADRFEWRVRTDSHEQAAYRNAPCANLLPRLSDEDFLREYQQADVLAMPMLDSAANDVILESMACGTPVMVNRVGGVPEYVDPACNFLMSNDRKPDEWVEKLLWLEKNRAVAEQMRPATRAWAEQFDWKLIAEEYRAMYRDVLARG